METCIILMRKYFFSEFCTLHTAKGQIKSYHEREYSNSAQPWTQFGVSVAFKFCLHASK